MNRRQREKMFELLEDRDGMRCRICGRFGNSSTLVVDCIDNSGDHSDPENLQLLCKSHNTKKNPRGLGRFNPLKPSLSLEKIEPKRVSSAEMQKNIEAEPAFREWLYRMIQRNGGRISISSDLIDSAAEYCHCSQQTIRRYLSKTTSSSGWALLEEVEGGSIIRFRSAKERTAPSNEQSDPLREKLGEELAGPSEE